MSLEFLINFYSKSCEFNQIIEHEGLDKEEQDWSP